MHPHVPPEVIEKIIENVSFRDLRACALTCKDFLIPSQRLIFRKVGLRSVAHRGNINFSKYSSFQNAVASTPELALYVREFTLKDDGGERNLIEQPTLPSMLMLLSNLAKFKLSSRYDYDYKTFSPALKKALATLLLSPSIMKVTFKGIINLTTEILEWTKFIPTVELSYLAFVEKQHQFNADAECSSTKTLILGSQVFEESGPLLDCMSSSRMTLEKLVVKGTSYTLCDTKVAREIIKKQSNSLTALQINMSCFSEGFAVDFELLDFGDIPLMRTVKVIADFTIQEPSALNDAIQILSQTHKENRIQQIIIEVMFASLEEVTKDCLESDWKTLDALLSGSSFSGLQKVDFRPNLQWIRYHEEGVPGGAENFKNVVRCFLPMLKESGRLDLDNITVISD
ncbi:hypothetical protein BDQ17DRAFT_1374115 [Cyathus striatus]|nr:hypothetical protein BDQ17DRAFT_1374115 [Cyathus striatus]